MSIRPSCWLLVADCLRGELEGSYPLDRVILSVCEGPAFSWATDLGAD